MKWIYKISFLFILACGPLTINSAPLPQSLDIINFQTLLTNDLNYRIPEENTYYLIFSPKSCINCFFNRVKELLQGYCNFSLVIIAKPSQVEQIKPYVQSCHPIYYISSFDYDRLASLKFMRNDWALGHTMNKTVLSIDALTGANFERISRQFSVARTR